MKTLSQYREDVKNLMKKVADIDAKCVNESREITEAELALKNELLDTVEDIRKIIASMERQERIQKALESPEPAQTQPGPQNRQPASASRPNDRFGSLGEQLAAVLQAGRPGGHIDPRLFNAATGLGESVASDGGLR